MKFKVGDKVIFKSLYDGNFRGEVIHICTKCMQSNNKYLGIKWSKTKTIGHIRPTSRKLRIIK